MRAGACWVGLCALPGEAVVSGTRCSLPPLACQSLFLLSGGNWIFSDFIPLLSYQVLVAFMPLSAPRCFSVPASNNSCCDSWELGRLRIFYSPASTTAGADALRSHTSSPVPLLWLLLVVQKM